MKLTSKERREMTAMMELTEAKLKTLPATTAAMSREDRHLINKLADARNALREVLALA